MYSIDEINRFIKNVLKTDTLLTNDDLHEFHRLLSGGVPFKKYLDMVKVYDTHKTCSTTWLAKTKAYRCETCSNLTVMAMCIKCFEPERHQGHKYYSFFSNTAGKCDCGNADAMDSAGFCHRSGDIKAYPPDELIFPAVLLLPPFISKTLHLLLGLTPSTAHSFYQKFRHRYYGLDSGRSTESREFVMLSILERMSTSNDTLRGIICEALTNKDYYNPRVEKVFCKKLDKDEILGHELYGFTSSVLLPLIRVMGGLKINRVCMLDSFFIWALKEDFHERILNWFLSLTSESRFKWSFARSYATNYGIVMLMIKNPKTGPIAKKYLSPVVLEITSMPNIALTLVQSYDFMKLVLNVLLLFLPNFYGEDFSQIYRFKQQFARRPPYLNFSMKYRGLYPHMYLQANDDFINIMNHRAVAYEFLFDFYEVKTWLSLITYFQGMHPLVKGLNPYEESENTLMRAFTTQVEICLHPMWTMLHHFKDISQEIIGLQLFHPVLEKLEKWVKNHELNFHVTFYHIPFHRIFSLVLFSEMMVGNLREKNVQIEEEFLKRLVHSPIRLWASSAEQLVGKWPRNSSTVITYSKLYRFTTFFCSTVDPDIFFVQFACTQMHPDFLVHFTLENFDTLDQLISSFTSDSHINKNLYMLDEVLFYFAILTNARVLSGHGDKKMLREEIVNMLSKKPLTRTEFLKTIPYRGLTVTRSWESKADGLLQELAYLERETFGTRNEPLQGQYHIKTNVMLHEYDPVMVRMRSITSDEFNNSVTNYTQRLQKEQLVSSQDNIWPPFRKPIYNHHAYLGGYTNFLNSPSLHGLLFVILYKCQQKMRLSTLQITIHLLNMALKFPYIHKPEVHASPFYNNLYQNCLVQFDYEFNIVGNYGLFNLFDEVNEHIVPTPHHIKKEQYGYNQRNEELKSFSSGPKWYQHVDPSARSQETILSLLLKLFKDLTKKTYLPFHMRGEGAVRYGSPDSTGVRIGGAEYFIGEVLDQLVDDSEEVLNVVKEYVARESKNNEEDEEEKRLKMKKKAQAKKAQLMKKMAAKGKKYLETNEIEIEPEESSVKCIECDQPMDSSLQSCCVMVYISRTQLLGHRSSEYHPNLSYINENTFRHTFKKLYEFNKNMFPGNSLPIEWYDNLWIQSCNHPIHFMCYFKLMERTTSLLQRELELHLRKKLYDREVWCPYCRQLCNIVLPLPIPTNVVQRFIQPDHHLITSLLDFEEFLPLEIDYMEKYVLVWQYLAGYAMEYINTYRNNIELYLMEKRVLNSQEETRSLTFTSSKKVNINVVHYFCSCLAKEKIKKDDLNDLFAIHPEPETDSEKINNLALVDIKQLLAKSAALLPTNRKDLMGSVICFYINLYLLQLLSWLVFCTEKRELIRVIKKYKLGGTQLEYILNFMLDFFHQPKTLQINDEPFMEIFESRLKDFLMYCHAVFTSVCYSDDTHLNELQDYNTSELYAFFYPEFQNDHVSFVQCFGWSEELFNKYLMKICHHTNFLMQITSRFLVARRLMLTDWRPPHFITLPLTFDKFFEFCKTKTDGVKGGVGSSAMCLVCGDVFVLGPPETAPSMKPAKNHTEFCGRGTAIYLLTSNQVVIIWGQRIMTFNSPYVNTHGEDLPYFDEHKNLTLNEARLKLIERMWLLNYFDYFCKNWPHVLP